MTSRVSFPKLLKEISKNHLASLLITVLAFLIHLIAFFMNIQNTVNTIWIEEYADAATLENTAYIIEHLLELCAPNMTNMVVAMLIAAYLAFDYFRYLHSKKETDFFDSLPIRRQEQFKTRFISCFGIFIVLCTITLGLELGVVFSTGYGSTIMIQNMLWNLLCMLGCFLATWVTAVLAMVMTGHSIIALLGFGLFSSYVPLILHNLFPVYAGAFFDTYMSRSQDTSATISYYFSPMTLAYKLVTDYHYEGWNISRHWSYLIGIWVFALIVGVIAYLLFLRRPSETAGRAMAFEKINFAIRFLLVIPLALYLGLFLSEMASFGETPWLIFGIVLGAVLLHGIIECIFNFDIRALFTKKRQLVLTIILSLAFVCIFWFDIFRYDAYIPDAEDVERIQIESHDIVDESLYNYWGTEQDWIHGEFINDALLVAKDLIHENIMPDQDYYTNTITFTYHMKNGTKKYRCYTYDESNIPESLDKLSTLEDFKDDRCSLYTADRDKIKAIRCTNGVITKNLPVLTKEARDILIDTYLKEYGKQTYSQSFKSSALLQLIFEHEAVDFNDKIYDREDFYYIYPEFTETLSILKQYGIQTFQESEGIELTNLEIYDDIYWKENGGPTYINDAEQLRELQKHMLPSDFMINNYEKNYIHCDLQMTVNGDKQYINVFIPQDVLDEYLD